MGVVQRVKRPITRAGKKALIKREPKLIENPKQAVFLQGKHTSETVVKCLKDLYQLKKPDAVLLGKKNDILPFEDVTKVEFLSKKYDASLFGFCSHSKKRTHNLILGRMFDGHLLDMVELGVEKYKSIKDFPGEKIPLGLKPCIIFSGPIFQQNPDFTRIQNLLVDFFHRERAENIRLQGIEHVLMITAVEDALFFRSYRILLKKSGSRVPRVELEEIGPSVDFTVRRTKFASDDLFSMSCKRPKELKAKKVKNVKRDVFGSTLGRVHVKQQGIDKLQTRKMKGLRKTPGKKQPRKNQGRQRVKKD